MAMFALCISIKCYAFGIRIEMYKSNVYDHRYTVNLKITDGLITIKYLYIKIEKQKSFLCFFTFHSIFVNESVSLINTKLSC